MRRPAAGGSQEKADPPWPDLRHRHAFRPAVGYGGRDAALPQHPSLRTGQAVFPHPALQLGVLPSWGLERHRTGLHHREQPAVGEEGVFLPPFTPFSSASPPAALCAALRAGSIRSVHTEGSTHAHRARSSPACLALSGTAAGCSSFVVSIPSLPSCRSFAPSELPDFLATMPALTSRRLLSADGTCLLHAHVLLTVPSSA